MDFLSEYGLFLAKTITFVLAAYLVIAILFSQGRAQHPRRDHLEISSLNQRYRRMEGALVQEMLSKDELKMHRKKEKKEEKRRVKGKRSDDAERGRLFVLDFYGDLQASAVDALRDEITALLTVAQSRDEVVIRLESGGGFVTAYGLAASQLARIRKRGIPLTVCVDKVAASGGYMMACVADKILAAPFAVVGSIGVVAELPNFHRWLRNHDVDIEMHQAGEHKRTLTMFGEISEQGREKFREELETTHNLFKAFVSEYRPVVTIDEVATGEHWFGRQALANRLVDELQTSDDYLMERSAAAELYQLKYHPERPLWQRLLQEGESAARSLIRLLR